MSSHYLPVIIEVICLTLSSTLVISVNANTFHWNANTNAADTPLWQRTAQSTAVCVDIPANVSLCAGIGYTKMRLPNLLNHETLKEVVQQSNTWIPLSKLNCHPDTQLFLCSLFSPVCLDHPIPPCRSLCLSVQSSCETTMLKYGYPWPKIVECQQFPIDNDMCIQAQHSPPSVQTLNNKRPTMGGANGNKHKKGHRKDSRGRKQRGYHTMPATGDTPAPKEVVFEPRPGHLQRSPQLDSPTKMHEQPQVDPIGAVTDATTERPARKWNKDQRQLFNDIINNYCRSQWILKARLHPIDGQRGEVRVKNYRLIQGSIAESQSTIVLKANRTVIDSVANKQSADDTQTAQSRRRYFLMGRTEADGQLWLTFALQWPHKSAQLRKAIKAINSGDFDCQTTDNSDRDGSHVRLKSRRNRKQTSEPQLSRE